MRTVHTPITGHELLAVERFRDDTRHMIEFLMLTDEYSEPAGSCVRFFADDECYENALELEALGTIRIIRHCTVIEGHILPDKKKKRKRGRKIV